MLAPSSEHFKIRSKVASHADIGVTGSLKCFCTQIPSDHLTQNYQPPITICFELVRLVTGIDALLSCQDYHHHHIDLVLSYKGEDMISATGLRAWRIMYRYMKL